MKALKCLFALFVFFPLALAYSAPAASVPATYAPSAQKNSWECDTDSPDLRAEFDYLNKAYFDGRLKVTAIYWSETLQPCQLGVTHWWQESGMIKIVLNPNTKISADPETRTAVLLHEMCHAASFMWDASVVSVHDNHAAKSFKDQMARLQRLGCNPWPY